MRGAPRALANPVRKLGPVGTLGVGLAIGLALAAASLLVVVPRLVARADLPGRIASAVRSATGREPRLGAVRVAWPPLALRVEDVELPAAGGEARLAAGALVVRLALADVLAGRTAAREIEIEAPRVRVTLAPGAAGAADVAGDATGASAAGAMPRSREALSALGWIAAPRALGVERVTFLDGRAELLDERVAPALQATLGDMSGVVTVTEPGGGATFDVAGRLESGGALKMRGTLGASGDIVLEATFSSVDLAPASAYLGAGATLAGRVDGVLRAEGPPSSLRVLRFEGVAAGARVDLGSATVAGPLGVTLDLAGLFAAPGAIAFEVDASAAEVVYTGGFRKPPGSGATATGRIVVRGGLAQVDEVRIVVKDVAASGLLPGAMRTAPPPTSPDRAALEREVDRQLVPGAGRALLDAIEPVVPETGEESP